MRATLAGLVSGLFLCACGAAGAAEVASYKILKLEGNNVSWQMPRQGKTLAVTYSLVVEPVAFPGARNCRKMTSLNELVGASAVANSALREEVAAAFAMWQAVADITFQEAADPSRADILIGAQAEPEGWAYAEVFYNALSPQRVKPISKALICLNPAKRWKVGFDGDLKTYDLRYTLAHEIGHAIGLDHPAGAGQIMGYRYEERFRELQPGDVHGAKLLYGAPPSTDVAASPGDPDPAHHQSRAAESLGTRALQSRSP